MRQLPVATTEDAPAARARRAKNRRPDVVHKKSCLREPDDRPWPLRPGLLARTAGGASLRQMASIGRSLGDAGALR